MSGEQLEILFKQGLEGNMTFTDTGKTDLDIFDGTDLIVQVRSDSYHVDPTWDFHYKETHGITEAISGSMTFKNKGLMLDVQYGYRTHNGTQFLSEPALVIGIKDYSRDLEKEKLWAVDAFREMVTDIVKKGIDQFNEHELIPKLQKDPWCIEDIKNYVQTRKMHETVIEYCSKEDMEELAWLLADPSEVVQHMAVRKNGLAIAAFSNPTEITQLYAIRQNITAYDEIESPTENVIKEYKVLITQQEKALKEWFEDLPMKEKLGNKGTMVMKQLHKTQERLAQINNQKNSKNGKDER